LIDTLGLRQALADHLEIGADVRQVIAVDGHRHVRDRLAERRRIRISLQGGDPLVTGLKRVAPLAVSLPRDDDDRLRREIGGDFVEVVVAEMEQEPLDEFPEQR